MYDSDEFRACATMAQQETPIEEAVSRLIDFYGMGNEEARSYYIEAKAMKPELLKKFGAEIEAEELDQEPSLDKMLDLKDPKVLKGLGGLVKALQDEEAAKKS